MNRRALLAIAFSMIILSISLSPVFATPGNTTLSSSGYDATTNKITLTVKDPDGVRLIKVTRGTDSTADPKTTDHWFNCKNPASVTLTLDPSDFPISVIAADCQKESRPKRGHAEWEDIGKPPFDNKNPDTIWLACLIDGGIVVVVNKLDLLVPQLAAVSTMLVAVAAMGTYVKHNRQRKA